MPYELYEIQGFTYTDSTIGGSPSYLANTVFVPLKGIVEALGGEVTFSGSSATMLLGNVTAHLESSQARVQLIQGSTTTTITLPAEPNGQNEDIFVPADFFYQAFSIPVVCGNGPIAVRIG